MNGTSMILCVCGHYYSNLTGVASTADTESPLVFIDTAGLGLEELDVPDEESRGNEGERGNSCVSSHC